MKLFGPIAVIILFVLGMVSVSLAQPEGRRGGPPNWEQLLERMDDNDDGKISKDEFLGPPKRFERIDSNGDGLIEKAEFEEGVARRQGKRGRRGQPGKKMQDQSPGVGHPAPAFSLETLDGDERVDLEQAYQDRPLALVFGSYTCPPFRKALEGMEDVYRTYKDDVNFFFIYIKEAHPTDGRASRKNRVQGIEIAQPQSYEARADVAQICKGALDITMPILVDTMDDAVSQAYSASPNRFYLIDAHGQIAFKGGKGPRGTNPREASDAIEDLL